jgi:hypothetical protein
MRNSENAYCCVYCIPKVTLYFSTDKYDGICQNCINLLAIQAVFRGKFYKHIFSLFKDGYFNHQRFTFKLDRHGEIIDNEYYFLREGITRPWDSWKNNELPQKLVSRVEKWQKKFKPNKYQSTNEDIYYLRFWSNSLLIDISVPSPNCLNDQDASELYEFSDIWNTLMELGIEDVELNRI